MIAYRLMSGVIALLEAKGMSCTLREETEQLIATGVVLYLSSVIAHTHAVAKVFTSLRVTLDSSKILSMYFSYQLLTYAHDSLPLADILRQ